TLAVHLSHATGLKRADRIGLSDPYVQLSLRGRTLKSKVVKSSLNPTWNQRLEFRVRFTCRSSNL
ncbi:MAG: hypothetical protein SGPRY_010141, partial [Prymnesium sp.]